MGTMNWKQVSRMITTKGFINDIRKQPRLEKTNWLVADIRLISASIAQAYYVELGVNILVYENYII